MTESKKSIVFINQSSGYLMIDIIDVFKEKYSDITLITGDLNTRNKQLPKKVKVTRIISPKRNNSLQRLFTWTLGFFQISWKLFWLPSTVDLFIVSNPPMATLLPLFFKNKYKLLLFDIYPDALHQHNIFSKNSLLIKTWIKLNKRIYIKADKIFTLTQGMKVRASQYVEEKCINVVPIWTDNDFFKSIPKEENIFIKQNQLENKFIVMYSGNLGYTHKMDILVDVAIALKQYNIEILIIGEGAQKKLIQDKINNLGVDNCRLLPWQPMEMLPNSFASATVGVVSLGTEASSLSLPSKTFNLMSVGAPILCIADDSSELAQLIRKHEIGECFPANDLDGIIAFIKSLYLDVELLQKLSINSKKASQYFTPKNAQLFAQ